MCAACGHQASVIAGTIFQGTRTPLSVWLKPKKWRQRAWPTARARLGQLPHGVDVGHVRPFSKQRVLDFPIHELSAARLLPHHYDGDASSVDRIATHLV